MIEDDVRERFLREITAQVPADRIAELHLFRPLRRGATETGVAVIAVEQEAPAQAEAAAQVMDVDARDLDLGSSSGDGADAWPDGTAAQSLTADLAGPRASVVDQLDGANESADGEVQLPGSIAEAGAADDLGEEIDERADVSLARPAPTRPVRHTVFTARYRLTRKGAERGKWEFEVVADADAPLVTVDAVVRGVQRRAGDDDEPERLTAEGVRAALDGPVWQRTT
jgi:hypothetical protein